MDSRRLVMPPSVSIPLAIIFYNIFRYILGHNFIPPFFAGFLLGYLFYDMMHFSIHHYNFHNKLFLFIKKHHMKHHYMDNSKGYGVSYPLWDVVYSTNFDQNNSSDNKSA
jgi:sterol desaturase/sphingolipid hydroxylase (fatty acid hydroxylase superfamily)